MSNVKQGIRFPQALKVCVCVCVFLCVRARAHTGMSTIRSRVLKASIALIELANIT
jgi:hypothetical protein